MAKSQAYLSAVRTLAEKTAAQSALIPYPALSLDALILGIGGMWSSRSFRLLAKPPTFRERPIASLLHRSISWHCGSGYLGGLFSLREDCGLLYRFNPEKFGSYWTCEKSNLQRDRDVLGYPCQSVYQMVETSALILLGGASRAVEHWSKALGK